MKSATLLYEVPLARAELHLREGDERAAVEDVGRFLAIGRANGFRHQPFLLEGERLHDLALQACAIAASQLQARSALDELLPVLAWGLELEPSAEALYQIEMRTYLALGQPASGLLAYERCRRALAARKGVRPSPQTEVLAETLRKAIC